MSTIRIPSALRNYTEGQPQVQVEAATVGAAIERLAEQFPALAPHLFNEQGQLRPYVNLFLNDQDVRSLRGQQTAVSNEDKLMILPSIAGGTLKVIDHSALQTSMAIRLGLLGGSFIADQTWPVAVAATLMLLGTARGVTDFAFIYRRLQKLKLVSPELIPDNPEPHRFALGIGATFLSAASLAFLAGIPALGWTLAWIVIALTALNLFGGFCVGCAVYYWFNRLGLPGFSRSAPPGVLPGRRPPAAGGSEQ
jgi:molybdopterin converting factor small subunit